MNELIKTFKPMVFDKDLDKDSQDSLKEDAVVGTMAFTPTTSGAPAEGRKAKTITLVKARKSVRNGNFHSPKKCTLPIVVEGASAKHADEADDDETEALSLGSSTETNTTSTMTMTNSPTTFAFSSRTSSDAPGETIYLRDKWSGELDGPGICRPDPPAPVAAVVLRKKFDDMNSDVGSELSDEEGMCVVRESCVPPINDKEKAVADTMALLRQSSTLSSNASTITKSSTRSKLSQYKNIRYSYAGYGAGPQPGPKVFKTGKQLRVPNRGQILPGTSVGEKLYWSARLLVTFAFAGVTFISLAVAYGLGLAVLNDDSGHFSIGLYGMMLFTYLVIQCTFAGLEHRWARATAPPEFYSHFAPSTVALQISAYQEDPDYFRECIQGIMNLNYPKDRLKVICCIDGNCEESMYMAEIFQKVVADAGEQPAFFRWNYNFHELPNELDNFDNGVEMLKECIDKNRYVCIMQKWGGKREVMCTAFKSLAGKVDYVQVCDSDTKLDPNAMLELAWVLDTQPATGAVGGDVKIWNDGDSLISFLSSIRYWMAFNIERACQSYFGCVSCISGPIGMYRMKVVEEILDLWSDQKFLGDVCTFGDDRHLTNRFLQMGYATKYTPRSFCLTETPATYLRWLSQQTRWSKSYFREWLFNSMWWHKHNLWMTLESVVAGLFPFFVMYTILTMLWSGNLWSLVYVLITVQVVGLIKGLAAALIRGNLIMIFISLYSTLYITSLLPSKIWAILTINNKGWGTSGRRILLKNYEVLIPVTIWNMAIVGGIAYSLATSDYKELTQYREHIYLVVGAGAYVGYWILMVFFWKCVVQKSRTKKEDISTKDGNSQSVDDISSNKNSSNGHPGSSNNNSDHHSVSQWSIDRVAL